MPTHIEKFPSSTLRFTPPSAPRGILTVPGICLAAYAGA